MKKALFFLLSLAFASTFAQGSIEGVIMDAEIENSPLPFCDVYIKGSTNGTTTDFDGNFEIPSVEAGSHILVISFVGYEAKEIPVNVVNGSPVRIRETLKASAASLNEVVITSGPKIKETEKALVLEQKKSVVITQTIGAQELAKKGVSNAEAAVTKVAGITKSQGSKNVFVRGLGDRYNSTTLNGLPLPSDDPESKNISLDFFSSNVISNIGVNKTFNSTIYGDLGGANIDIKSKVVSKNSLSASSSIGVNSNASGEEFLRVGGSGDFGTGIKEQSPIRDRTLRTYNFGNPLQPRVDNTPINTSISVVAGGKTNVGNTKLSAFAVGSIKSGYQFQEGTNGAITAIGLQSRNQSFVKYNYNTSQLAMGGIALSYGGGNSISLTSLYIHNNTQSVGEYFGLNTSVKDDGNDVFIRRQQVNDNDLYVNQITGDHKLTDRLKLDYGGAFNFVSANEPDRRTNTFFVDNNGVVVPAQGSAGFNHRFYSELQEDDYAAKAELTFDLNSSSETDFIRNIKGGYNYRFTKRNFIFRQFNANILNQNEADIANVDRTFNQNTLNNGDFELQTDRGLSFDSRGREISALFPFFYVGDRKTNSGFVESVYQINDKLTLNGGIRYDKIDQKVDYDTALVSSVNGTSPDDTARLEKEYILPSLNVKYAINDNAILRLAGSLSYTLPQLREVAPFVYEGINFTTIGNPKIDASENYNLDLKGEYYFGEDETNVLTLTGFYKYIDSPINRVGSNSAANQITFVNVPEANVLGLELEFKMDLIKDNYLGDDNTLSFGFNGALLHSEQKQEDIDSDDITIRFTNSKDKLQGASPVLLNSDLTFQTESEKLNFTSSVIFNFFSERIFAVGVGTNENVVESAITGLDFVNKLKLNKKVGISLSVKNILDPKIELTQEARGEDIVLNSYRRGIDFSAGFSYQF